MSRNTRIVQLENGKYCAQAEVSEPRELGTEYDFVWKFINWLGVVGPTNLTEPDCYACQTIEGARGYLTKYKEDCAAKEGLAIERVIDER